MEYITTLDSYQKTDKIISNYLNKGYNVDIEEGVLIDNFIVYDGFNGGTRELPDYYNIVILEVFKTSWSSEHKVCITKKTLKEVI